MLNISHISKSFNPGTPNEKLVLNDLSLNVEKGDFITIIGANGAGKSTLLNAIAGSFIADSGTITMAGCDITLMPEHIRAKHIGRLFQDPMRGTAPRQDPVLWRQACPVFLFAVPARWCAGGCAVPGFLPDSRSRTAWIRAVFLVLSHRCRFP